MILDDLIALLRHFPDKKISCDMHADTYFFKDLGMASIDAVVLAEMLEQYYGQKFPFSTFMRQLQQTDVRDLQLGELAKFLQEHLQPTNAES